MTIDQRNANVGSRVSAPVNNLLMDPPYQFVHHHPRHRKEKVVGEVQYQRMPSIVFIQNTSTEPMRTTCYRWETRAECR